VDHLPQKTRRPKQVAQHLVALVARRRGRFFVRQRARGGLNASLWEFPTCEAVQGQPAVASLAASLLGVCPALTHPLGVITHSITRHRITQSAYLIDLDGQPVHRRHKGRWLTLAALRELPFSGAHRKILELVATRLLEHRAKA
jgi:adenine-specific DNA glycosylase